MKHINIAVSQFEPKDGDKSYNLSVIEAQTEKAKTAGANIISFHEMSVTAYTFLKELNKDELLQLAEKVPEGESCQQLVSISKKYNIAVLAGLLELEDERVYNTYICVNQKGLIARHRKLHPFIRGWLYHI